MVVDPKKPNRNDLLRISGINNRTLMAVERLFEVAGEETPADLDNLQAQIDLINTDLDEVSARAKSNGVLLWLTM